MPKVVKYGIYEAESMEMTIEALRNGDAGLNVALHGLFFSKNIPGETLRWEKVFCGEIYSTILRLDTPIVLLS
jgi:hypothetical protein